MSKEEWHVRAIWGADSTGRGTGGRGPESDGGATVEVSGQGRRATGFSVWRGRMFTVTHFRSQIFEKT